MGDSVFGRVLVAAVGASDELLVDYVLQLAALWPAATFVLAHILRSWATPSGGTLADPPVPESLRTLIASGRLAMHARIGEPLDLLLYESEALRADLILVGAGGDARRVLARRLAMNAACSVWMVPPSARPRIERVLATVDFSPRSADTVAVAARVAATAGLSACDVLHVRVDPGTAGFEEHAKSTAAREEHQFNLFAARIDTHGVGLDLIIKESGDLAATIVRTAFERDSDVIVMGTRGRSRASSIILGSETEHVLMTSPVPVLAVKHFGSQLRVRDAIQDRPLRRRDLKFS